MDFSKDIPTEQVWGRKKKTVEPTDLWNLMPEDQKRTQQSNSKEELKKWNPKIPFMTRKSDWLDQEKLLEVLRRAETRMFKRVDREQQDDGFGGSQQGGRYFSGSQGFIRYGSNSPIQKSRQIHNPASPFRFSQVKNLESNFEANPNWRDSQKYTADDRNQNLVKLSFLLGENINAYRAIARYNTQTPEYQNYRSDLVNSFNLRFILILIAIFIFDFIFYMYSDSQSSSLLTFSFAAIMTTVIRIICLSLTFVFYYFTGYKFLDWVKNLQMMCFESIGYLIFVLLQLLLNLIQTSAFSVTVWKNPLPVESLRTTFVSVTFLIYAFDFMTRFEKTSPFELICCSRPFVMASFKKGARMAFRYTLVIFAICLIIFLIQSVMNISQYGTKEILEQIMFGNFVSNFLTFVFYVLFLPKIYLFSFRYAFMFGFENHGMVNFGPNIALKMICGGFLKGEKRDIFEYKILIDTLEHIIKIKSTFSHEIKIRNEADKKRGEYVPTFFFEILLRELEDLNIFLGNCLILERNGTKNSLLTQLILCAKEDDMIDMLREIITKFRTKLHILLLVLDTITALLNEMLNHSYKLLSNKSVDEFVKPLRTLTLNINYFLVKYKKNPFMQREKGILELINHEADRVFDLADKIRFVRN